MRSPLKFRLVVGSMPVVLEGSDGVEVPYELREMVAAVRDHYLDQLGDRMKTDATGKVTGVRQFDGLQASLLAVCLFDGSGTLVPKVMIQTWPAGTVSGLFEAAQHLNRLNVTAEEAKAELGKL